MLDGDVCRWIEFAKSVQMEKYYHFKKDIILFQNSMKTNKLSNVAGPTQASLIIWPCVCACSINPFFSKVKSFPTHFVIMQRLNLRIPCSKRSLCAKQLKKTGNWANWSHWMNIIGENQPSSTGICSSPQQFSMLNFSLMLRKIIKKCF